MIEMIKVENVKVAGFETAVRAARNPMSSWGKSDSKYDWDETDGKWDACETVDVDYVIGDADMGLMQRLFKAGVEHRTYARMIYVWMDITAPLYWWKEMDRYTVGKSQVSTSTMHKIHAKEFTIDDFSHEHLNEKDGSLAALQRVVDDLNMCRDFYNVNNKDEQYWWWMIQLLPSSYNQKRTICMSYETVFKIIRERTGHKLDEWRDFVELLKALPYVGLITGETE